MSQKSSKLTCLEIPEELRTLRAETALEDSIDGKDLSRAGSRVMPFDAEPETDAVGADEFEDLPFQGFRAGTWWYATYHSVTAIVGVGVLGLPTAMAYLGWGLGAVLLTVWWLITLFTLWQMVQMHEMTDEKGNPERFRTYTQLGQKAFGRQWGTWIVLPQQLAVQLWVNIAYIAAGGQSLWLFYQLLLCPSSFDPVALGHGDQCCGRLGRTTFTIIFAIFPLVFAQLANYRSIASLSIAASVTSICYCTIAWVAAVHLGKSTHGPLKSTGAICPLSYSFSHDRTDQMKPYLTQASQVFRLLCYHGVVGVILGDHNVVLEIQSTIPSTRQQPSKIRMWRGIMVAYILILLCYFPVAFAGYWALGTSLARIGDSKKSPTRDNILLQLGGPKPWIAAANLMVAIHLNGSYQLYAVPVYDLIEKILVKRFSFRPPTLQGKTPMLRITIRTVYVCFTAFIACTISDFFVLRPLFGVASITGTFLLPCILWLRIKRPSGARWFINWLIIFVGSLSVLFLIVGQLGNIITADQSTEQPLSYLNCTDIQNFPASCTSRSLGPSRKITVYEFICKSSQNIDSPKCQYHFVN